MHPLDQFQKLCPECGKPFKARSNKVYCSHKCRSKASVKRTTGSLSSPPTIPMKNTDSFNSYLQNEVTYWRNRSVEAEKKLQELGAGKAGLNGLADSPLVQSLAGSIPQILEFLSANKQSQPGQGGNSPVDKVAAYFTAQPKDLQDELIAFLGMLDTNGPERAVQILKQLNNFKQRP